MNEPKKFKIPGDLIKQFMPQMGSCLATDRITVDGCKVGYMYREQPDNNTDSGWRFFSGDESEEYVNNPQNIEIYDLNSLCNYDPTIMPYLNADFGVAFGRIEETNGFKQEDFQPED